MTSREIEARFFIATTQLDKAEKRINFFDSTLPERSSVRILQAWFWVETENYERAGAQLDAILKQYPMQLEALQLKKQVLLKLERYRNTLPFLEALLLYTPEDRELIILKTHILFHLEESSDVVAYVDECRTRNSNHLLKFPELIPLWLQSLLALENLIGLLKRQLICLILWRRLKREAVD